MTKVIEKIVEKVKETAKDNDFCERHKRRETDFTRKRNLSFEDLVHFVIGNIGTSMDF